MGTLTRWLVVVIGVVTNTIFAVIWARGGAVVVDVAQDIDPGGPFSGSLAMINTVVPVVIAVVYIILLGYLLYGPVREQRVQGVRRI